jgi:hypothetical protein
MTSSDIAKLEETIKFTFRVTCQLCGERREHAAAFRECGCTLPFQHTAEEYDKFMAEMVQYSTLHDALGSWNSSSVLSKLDSAGNLGRLADLVIRMSPMAKRFLFYAPGDARHDSIRHAIEYTRRLVMWNPSFDDMIAKVKKLPVSFLRAIGYSQCFEYDCKVPAVELCTAHTFWYYTAHVELLLARMNDLIVRMCLNYLLPEYDTIRDCLPGSASLAAPLFGERTRRGVKRGREN